MDALAVVSWRPLGMLVLAAVAGLASPATAWSQQGQPTLADQQELRDRAEREARERAERQTEQNSVRTSLTSNNGDISLVAKEDLVARGADIAAGNDVTLVGRNVILDAATDTLTQAERHRVNQAGGTIALSGYGVQAAQATKGFLNKTKVCDNGCAVAITDPAEQAILQRIVKEGDQTGALTEELLELTAKGEGFISLPGAKVGSNNGFDHVLVHPEGLTTVIIDSKQIYNGAIQLGSSNAGVQLSTAWIRDVLTRMSASPAKTAVQNALNDGTLKIAVAGVNKEASELVIVNVNRF